MARAGEDGVFDPATVIGLQSHHQVLVLGNPAFMPWLTQENNNIASTKKLNELERLVSSDYDRVIIGREYDANHWTTNACAQVALAAKRGLMIYFPKSEGDAWTFMQSLEFAFPLSRVWDVNSTFGRVIMVDFGAEYIQ